MMALGPIMTNFLGTALRDDDRELLRHPLIGGVILFSDNYESLQQISELISELHSLCEPRLLVAIDHEGGRVQRFRDGFTNLPAARLLGMQYEQNAQKGCTFAEISGWLMAIELRAVGVDFSFAPVLDIDAGISEVIGDRAFHHAPQCVAELAKSYIGGMRRAGMSAVGKHFPGHGNVQEDSHYATPIDTRSLREIQNTDLVVFKQLVSDGLAAVMPAHVIYSSVDSMPAGFSDIWLNSILRNDLKFTGAVFSDDINMAGASYASDYLQRASLALNAGCDMLLLCHNQPAVVQLLETMVIDEMTPQSAERLQSMYGQGEPSFSELQHDREWQAAVEQLAQLR